MVEQLIQIAGSLLVLAAFIAAQRGRLDPKSPVYLAFNLLGSATLAIDAGVGGEWGFLLLEGIWALVSLVGLVNVRRRRATRITGWSKRG